MFNFSFALSFKGIEAGKLLISSLCKFSKLILKEFIFLENPYSHVYTEEEKNKVAKILIKYGVDASGTKYEKAYDAYWSKIVK